jgi:hypothetical protein
MLILVMGSGGGELPALDGMLFHGHRAVPVTMTSHVEAWGGCHADQCTIRTTAQHRPLTPAVAVPTLKVSEPEAVATPSFGAELLPAFPVFQPFSRAPPSLQV